MRASIVVIAAVLMAVVAWMATASLWTMANTMQSETQSVYQQAMK
jgi:hypothetical protein